jgi:hypothetical protein
VLNFQWLSGTHYSGWHNEEYIRGEFYGVWGDFDVTIKLPSDFIVGSTGAIQNPEEVKCGYEFSNKDTILIPKDKGKGFKTWHFKAENVHDFAWVADREYIHQISHLNNVVIHLLYKKNARDFWFKVSDWTKKILSFYNNLLGKYEYNQITISMAGDRGMEYPQLVMITGFRPEKSLAGVLAHEIGHQWFYGMVGNNETQEAWLDEGFTNFISTEVKSKSLMLTDTTNPYTGFDKIVYNWDNEPWRDLQGYYNLSEFGFDEPLSTYHDKFKNNSNSEIVYSKGETVLRQLRYFLGDNVFWTGMKLYVTSWKFHHPTLRDFELCMENASGVKLDDFFNNWIGTTKKCDYSLNNLQSNKTIGGFLTSIEISKNGEISMPLDILLTYSDGSTSSALVPLENYYKDNIYFRLPPWRSVSKEYQTKFITPKEVVKAEIDHSLMLADLDRTNNVATTDLISNLLPNVQTAIYKRWDLKRPLSSYSIRFRPSLWYSDFDGVQIGFIADGGYVFNKYNSKIGLYYNFKSNRIDYDLQYSTRVNELGRDAKLNLGLTNYFGNQIWDIGFDKIIREELNSKSINTIGIKATRNYNLILENDNVNYITLYHKFSNSSNKLSIKTTSKFFSSFLSQNSFLQWTIDVKLNFLINKFQLEGNFFTGVSTGDLPNLFKFNLAGSRELEIQDNVVHNLVKNINPKFMQSIGLILPQQGFMPSLGSDSTGNNFADNIIGCKITLNDLLKSNAITKIKWFDFGLYSGLGVVFNNFKSVSINDINFEIGATAYLKPLLLLPNVIEDAINSPNDIKLMIWFPAYTISRTNTNISGIKFGVSISN